MNARDLIGKRGELIACTRLMDFRGSPAGFFNPYPLGEKCPLFDLLVELEGVAGPAAYFLAQVKATAQPGGKRAGSLPIRADAAEVGRMARSPFPTYLIGIDVPAERAYVVSTRRASPGPVSSMPRKYPLTGRNLKALWHEVADYWSAVDLVAVRPSRFVW